MDVTGTDTATSVFRPGGRGAAVTEVRDRPNRLGPLRRRPDQPADVFDAELDRAVRLFQQQRGLSVDARWRNDVPAAGGSALAARRPGAVLPRRAPGVRRRRRNAAAPAAAVRSTSTGPTGSSAPCTDAAVGTSSSAASASHPTVPAGLIPAPSPGWPAPWAAATSSTCASLDDLHNDDRRRRQGRRARPRPRLGSAVGAPAGGARAHRGDGRRRHLVARVEGRLAGGDRGAGPADAGTGRRPRDRPAARAQFANAVDADLAPSLLVDSLDTPLGNGLATFYDGDSAMGMGSVLGARAAAFVQDELTQRTDPRRLLYARQELGPCRG